MGFGSMFSSSGFQKSMEWMARHPKTSGIVGGALNGLGYGMIAGGILSGDQSQLGAMGMGTIGGLFMRSGRGDAIISRLMGKNIASNSIRGLGGAFAANVGMIGIPSLIGATALASNGPVNKIRGLFSN